MIRLLAARAVRVSAFVVAFLGASAVSAFALPGEVHRYRLNEWTGLDDEIGGISLVALNGATEAANTGRSDDGTTGTDGAPFTCLPATVRCEQGYRFGAGQGLALASPSIGSTGPFTIVLDFMLDPSDGTHKLLDFSNLCSVDSTCNAGLYVAGNQTSNRRLVYRKDSGVTNGTPNGIVAGTMNRVVITRGDGASSRVVVYQDGVVSGLLDWPDSATDALLSGSPPTLNFFVDDAFGGAANSEHAAGFVDTIRVFNRALTQSEVAALVDLGDTEFSGGFSEVPEPGTLLLMGAGLLVIGTRLRKRNATK